MANRRVDYAAEGRRVMGGSGSKGFSFGSMNDIDVTWENKNGGGKVFTGNITAASNLDLLKRYKITNVVNCQDRNSKNFFENSKSGIKYKRFVIEDWFLKGMSTEEQCMAFFQPYYDFVEEATSKGENVLVHCLAGAHRAGTATVGLLMHKERYDMRTAITIAKERRPIIDPIHGLVDLLRLLEKTLRKSRSG